MRMGIDSKRPRLGGRAAVTCSAIVSSGEARDGKQNKHFCALGVMSAAESANQTGCARRTLRFVSSSCSACAGAQAIFWRSEARTGRDDTVEKFGRVLHG